MEKTKLDPWYQTEDEDSKARVERFLSLQSERVPLGSSVAAGATEESLQLGRTLREAMRQTGVVYSEIAERTGLDIAYLMLLSTDSLPDDEIDRKAVSSVAEVLGLSMNQLPKLQSWS